MGDPVYAAARALELHIRFPVASAMTEAESALRSVVTDGWRIVKTELCSDANGYECWRITDEWTP